MVGASLVGHDVDGASASGSERSANVPGSLSGGRVLSAHHHRQAARRIVFFDVENSSRADHVARVLEHLGLTPRQENTRIVAMGNWRVVGYDTADLLARSGAEMIHSAPASRVKDWTDMRIAVAAGLWLGAAMPGDVLEIVTDDQAFDAVGDVAAGHGVQFQRVSHRRLVASGDIPRMAPASPKRRRSRPRKRRP